MKDLYRILTPAQRCAALVAVDTYRGNDFMGWRGKAESALRTPGEVIRSGHVIDALFGDLGGAAGLAEQTDGSHRLTNRPTLAIECRGARAAIAAAYGWANRII